MTKQRPYFKPWKTPTGLLLYIENSDEQWKGCIAGDRVKELLATPDRRAASEYMWTVRDSYEVSADG